MNWEKLHIIVLYCFVFLLHFEYWSVFGKDEDNMTITKFVGYLYFILALRDVERFFLFSRIKTFLIPVLAFFGMLTIISYANYNSLYQQFANVIDFSALQCILMFWIVCNHLNGQPKVIYRTLVAFVAGAVVMGILYKMGVGVTITDGRLSMFGDDENAVGIRMALAIVVVLSLIFENPLNWKTPRFLLLLALPFLFPVLALSGSRTALICMAIGLLIFILLIRLKPLFKAGFLVIAAAGVILMVNYFSHYDTLQQRLVNSISYGDTAGRTSIWKHILPIFYESPIVGVGTTGYAKRAIPVFGVFKGGHYRSPHNVYLEMLCYTGVVGLGLFLLFLGRVSFKSVQLYLRNNYIVTGILILITMIDMFVGQGLYNKIFWYFYAVIVALQLNEEPELSNEPIVST